ncbi:MAG: AI-2E family transporter [Candidatus Faecousia sp.]|nr:AI-2E family transporter [Candidatus Faecousia sp.]
MHDPKQKRYLYLMLSGFGAISLSILLFFVLYRLRGIGQLLQTVTGILLPFIYGGVVAYLARPMCNTYEKFLMRHLPEGLRRFSPSAAVVGSLVTLLLIVYALGAMIFPQVYDSVVTLGKTIPSRLESFVLWAETTFGESEYMDALFDFFNTSYEKIYMQVDAWIRNDLFPQITTLVSSVSSSVFAVLRSLYNLIIGLIVAVYVLSSRKRFARQSTLIVRSVLSEKWANAVLEEVTLMDRMFGGFIDAKILDSLIIGILCYLGCWVLRIPNTLLISVFVGITNIIPFFGPLIGAVPSTLLILIESPIKAVWFVIFVVVLQQLDGNVIGPRIMGNKIGISGFWVMFAIIFFGGVWGIVGMVIGVPLFAVIYDLVRKLVKYGLRKKGKSELWDKYAADYPNDELPKAQELEPVDWSWASVKSSLATLMKKAKENCERTAAWVKTCWVWLITRLKALWNLLKKAWQWCSSRIHGAASKRKK